MTRSRAKFGTNCLLARRLVERGVRFVELYSGSGSGWDAHNDLDKNHAQRCQETDVPIAGLLTDLKARGLLDNTLVVWGGEFGRTPFNEKGNGRDHNPVGLHDVDGRRWRNNSARKGSISLISSTPLLRKTSILAGSLDRREEQVAV